MIVTNHPEKAGTMAITMDYLNLIECVGNTMARNPREPARKWDRVLG